MTVSKTTPWRDIRAMCGYASQLAEGLTGSDRGRNEIVMRGLMFVATRPSLAAFWAGGDGGAAAASLYSTCCDVPQSRFTAVLRSACTSWASPSTVSDQLCALLAAHPISAKKVALHMHWRLLDATYMLAPVLRLDIHQAFEAIWLAGEYEEAYALIERLCYNADLLHYASDDD